MNPSQLFLPFVPSGKAIELQAIEVKERLRLGPYASVDPEGILERLPARLLGETDFPGLSEAAHAAQFAPGGEVSASGFGRSPATGEHLILVNPAHHHHRRRVSLMEEIVHITLGHSLTTITVESGKTGRATRSYDGAVEEEAYAVGAACIIPYRTLFNAVRDDHAQASHIAEQFNVSEQYAIFRIRKAGLAKVYAKHCVLH